MMGLCILILVGSVASSVMKKRDKLATDQEV
jgi:hypothetical protein